MDLRQKKKPADQPAYGAAGVAAISSNQWEIFFSFRGKEKSLRVGFFPVVRISDTGKLDGFTFRSKERPEFFRIICSVS